MKRAKLVITGILIAGLLASLVVAPQAAEAGGRYWGGHGGPRHSHGHGHGHGHGYGSPAYFWGGLAAGAVTGIIVGSIFAPRVWAAPVVVQPVPVVVQPAPVIVQPVCANQWVPTQWNGYQWVPGYWAQVCR